ncbi:MAG: sigma 54-interacting transcriptional regulator [Methylotenera sp.]|nr:sigma 54-interacting transcriptional regulator [Methylotenera sp.]
MQKQCTILAVDDEPNMRRLLEISLRQAGYKPLLAADGNEALVQIKNQHIDLVVSDLHMPGMNGLALLKAVRQENETLPFIMVTALGEIKTAVDAMKVGASDYILRPFDLETLEIAIAKALSNRRLQLENTYLKADNHAGLIDADLIGESPLMLALKQLIKQVAPEKATVLITGETGTGKELVAKAIHAASLRKNGLFVAINCAAIPAEILESELFGHEKGAFTGAVKERIGKFELADGGTLFLDEISEMPIQLQAKLLRVLQEGVVEKIGSNKSLTLDVRVIAATNRDPLQAVKDGKLREDLYYRLNVFQLNTPPLRQQLRILIMDAARELFVSRGVEAVTMREIAKRIGYSATSIYHHFSDKEALIRAVCDTDFLALADALKNNLVITDPVERMLAFGRGYAQFALNYPNHYRMMFMTEHPPCDPAISHVQQNNAEQDAYFQLKIVVNEVFLADKFKPDLKDSELIAQTVWAGMHGVCALQISMANDIWVNWTGIEERLQMMQLTLMRGLMRDQ